MRDGLKTVVAGSRSITNFQTVVTAIEGAEWPLSRVLSGDADGVDSLGIQWAEENDVPVDHYPPDYDTYSGRLAPLERNSEMADDADALIAIWDGKSTGTKHMIGEARKQGIRIHIHRTDSRTLRDFS
jgi:hypothetical protein